MSVHALHQGISYELMEVRDGEWQWAFVPPFGPRRTGHVVGSQEWAFIVAQRAIEVWCLMNRRAQNEAA